MARKRMEDPSLKSWDEVNAALKLIRDNEIELELIEADMGKKIADIKEQAAEQAVPYRDDIKKLELQVKEFVTLNKAELKGKSREMDFGKVGLDVYKRQVYLHSIWLLWLCRVVLLPEMILIRYQVHPLLRPIDF